MKKLFLYSALATLTLFSCQKDEDLNVNPNSESLGDSQTSMHSQPYILSEIASNGKTNAPPGSGWSSSPVFSDEFDDSTLDEKKWTKLTSTTTRSTQGRASVLKWWGWLPDMVTQNASNGLVLKSKKETDAKFKCGAVNSNKTEPEKGPGERAFGYFEARIDIQDPQYGSHTAFWLQGDNQSSTKNLGSDGAEIDIFESCWTNDKTRTTIHIDGYNNNSTPPHQSTGGAPADEWGASGMKTGYHIWGLDWSRIYLRAYYDGVMKKEFTNAKWIPTVKEYIILSTGAAFAIDDEYSGARGYTKRSIEMVTSSYVDYVRVWSKTGPNYN